MQFAIEPLGKCLLDDAVFFRIKEQLLISLRVFHISLLCSCVKDTGENTSLINLPIIAFSSFFDFCILAHFCIKSIHHNAVSICEVTKEFFVDSGNDLIERTTMQRDNKKNGSYRCVMKRLNTGFDCSEEKVPEADILEAVIDTIQVYAQYAVSIDRLLQTRQAQRQLDRKQAQRQLQTLQSRKARLDKRLQDLYERLVEGEISRESFAAQKKALTAQAEEISHTVLELERKISDSDDGGNAVIEQFKSYAGITALTREISIERLHSVTIYPDGRMDIRLNLADEIKALMETLRRESCTA